MTCSRMICYILTVCRTMRFKFCKTYTANKYDEKGRLTASQHQNLLMANPADQVISQKDTYEYDKYGYLTQIAYQRILGNNQKTSGYLFI